MKMKKFAFGLFLIAMLVMSTFTVMAVSDNAQGQNMNSGEDVDVEDESDEEDSNIREQVREKVQENMEEHPGLAYGKYSETGRSIVWIMEENGLTEENTIADLLEAINEYKGDLETDAMENYGVETREELKEAIAEEKIEWLREKLGMDESATAEEVMEEAHTQRMDLMKEMLGLEESATDEEVREAMKEWKEENKHLFKQKWRFKFWGWV
ncbi:MAG: hypothetical protein ABIJ18_01395 [archaeon]